MRWFFPFGIIVIVGTASAPAQRRLPWTAPPPTLALGQRVRVATWQAGFTMFGTRPFPVTREVRLVGTLVAYSPADSVRITPTGPFALLSASQDRTVYWADLSRIDVPNGRNTLDGAARGLAGAFGLALLGNLAAHAFGCDHGNHNCPNVWTTTARISLVSVPVGAVYGFFSTRWKRVY